MQSFLWIENKNFQNFSQRRDFRWVCFMLHFWWLSVLLYDFHLIFILWSLNWIIETLMVVGSDCFNHLVFGVCLWLGVNVYFHSFFGKFIVLHISVFLSWIFCFVKKSCMTWPLFHGYNSPCLSVFLKKLCHLMLLLFVQNTSSTNFSSFSPWWFIYFAQFRKPLSVSVMIISMAITSTKMLKKSQFAVLVITFHELWAVQIQHLLCKHLMFKVF